MADQALVPVTKDSLPVKAAPVPWQSSPAGRAKLARAQRLAHRRDGPRDTSPLTPETIRRLFDLLKEGKSVKKAASVLKIGYSTAQRYASQGPKTNGGSRVVATIAPQKQSGPGKRLSAQSVARIKRLLSSKSPLSVRQVAEREGVSTSAVYHYKALLNSETRDDQLPVVHSAAAQSPGTGLSTAVLADLRHIYKLMYEDAFRKQRPLERHELRFADVWKRINGEE